MAEKGTAEFEAERSARSISGRFNGLSGKESDDLVDPTDFYVATIDLVDQNGDVVAMVDIGVNYDDVNTKMADILLPMGADPEVFKNKQGKTIATLRGWGYDPKLYVANPAENCWLDFT